MMTFATQDDTARRLSELADLERDAWESYREETVPLDAAAYAHAEPTAWDALQATLAEVATERAALLGDEPQV